jgi:hypothetical protein
MKLEISTAGVTRNSRQPTASACCRVRIPDRHRPFDGVGTLPWNWPRTRPWKYFLAKNHDRFSVKFDNIYHLQLQQAPITVAARSKAWTVFACSNIGVMGSNPTRGMDVCVPLLCVWVAVSRRANPPSKESYRLCIWLRKWKSDQGPTKGCRAVDR